MLDLRPKLTKENILKEVRDSDIFNYYCPHFNKGFFPGEFRMNKLDKKPSANIFCGNDSKWRYSDFGEVGTLDCFDYVGRKFNLGFKDTLTRINTDMNLKLGESSGSPSSFKPRELKLNQTYTNTSLSTTVIKVKRRDYIQKDKDYWYGKYYIKEDLFKQYHNAPLSQYWIFKNGGDGFPIIPSDLCYTQDYYTDSSGIFRRKIYRPNNSFKWTTNITGLVVQGIKLLPKTGDILIITKSMKDLLVLRTIGYPAVIAVNNETSWIPDKIRLKLEERFKHIFINFDNDETGIKVGNQIAETYNYEFIKTNSNDYKDPSDMIEVLNPTITKQYFDNLIHGN